jgi:alpha-ketoglutarate-dependent 2,4-dichlorophenoxyacetate dioxygenase
MSIEIEPLHPLVGARLHGLDLSRPLGDEQFAAVREALHRHQMLTFPNQQLSQRQMLTFAERFGKPEVFPDPTEAIGEVPHVLRLGNLDESGNPYGPCLRMERMSLAENWHTDSSYRRVPALATFLHGVVLPETGTHTHFTSLHAAYDALPDALRRQIEPLSAIHNWEYQRTLSPGRAPMTVAERAGTPPVAHRLVQTHAESGRKLLYISSSAQRVEGLPYAEGRALLAELLRIAILPSAVYSHPWSPLDLVMWDNRATLHRAGQFDYQSLTLRRLMHRVVIGGNPAAYPVQPVPAEVDATPIPVAS